ncbi:flagellar basal-body rod protein FlgF [Asticcacaulis solisilvae]|uniref:flagellar basal-body rod protein FlgF n=1 Tax=Asticcacaulis solisilvae TaxID=1217274 RepID=UPI003FD85F36
MDNANYVALSRQITLQRELDISANNLANMNTTGFKFEQLLVNSQFGAPAYDDPIRTPANFAYDNGVGRNFKQGTLTQTGSPYDMAIDGEGAFFSIQTANGTQYTRDGAFGLNQDGTLVTQNGDTVLGDGGPIVLDPKNGTPVISQDGIVSQTAQGQTLRVGKISVVRVANLSDMKKEGNGNFTLTNGASTVPATDARVRQGMLESSNVNPMVEITKLVQINRTYSQISAMMEQNNTLSRTAVERLGKVA